MTGVAVEKLFQVFQAQNSLCKLLNFRTTDALKFPEITALVPFSATHGFDTVSG
jgi:hypothetical protein